MSDSGVLERITTRSARETEQWAEGYAANLTAGCVLALIGDLGTGKTVIARGVGRGLGVRETVISPTFNYVLEYHGRLPFFHADLYRIESAATFLAMGLDEYLDRGGVYLIEWAERIRDLLPASAVVIELREGKDENERMITLRRKA